MLSLAFVQNPKDRKKIADAKNQYLHENRIDDYAVTDTSILLHPAVDWHHFIAHVTNEGVLLLTDLLVTSDKYLRILPQCYDTALFERLEAAKPTILSAKQALLHLKKPKNEKYLFMMAMSAVLSEHYQAGKVSYEPELTATVLERYVTALIDVGYSRPDAELLLGNASPYQNLLLSEEFTLFDFTADRLNNATYGASIMAGNPLRDITGKKGITPLPTPDLSKRRQPQFPSAQDNEALNFLLEYQSYGYMQNFLANPSEQLELTRTLNAKAHNLLADQLNRFLPARRAIEDYFWQNYIHAQCSFPQSGR